MRGLILLLVVSAALASPRRFSPRIRLPQVPTPREPSPQGAYPPRASIGSHFRIAGSPQEAIRPRRPPSATPEERCNDLLKSVEERVGNKTGVEKCIAEQTGLQAILDKLKASSTASGPHSSFPTIILAEARLTEEALALRRCISRENKQVVTAAKLKSELAAKVAGTSSQANTTLGLDKCPVALLDNFEVFKYMGCIKSYCATGAAPKN